MATTEHKQNGKNKVANSKPPDNLKIVYRKIDDLIFSEYNPRQMTAEQAKALTDSVRRFGLVDPIIVNKHPDRDNIVIGGHMRLRVAKELGITEVPTVEVSLPLDRERELNVRLNKNTGEFDWGMLSDLFEESDLLSWGFTEEELLEGFGIADEPASGLTDDDATPEVKEAICKPGDLWLLGGEHGHRLLCGDCTVKANVERLMAGEKADMVFTDPPYGHNNNNGDLIHNWEKALGRPQTKSSAARPIANDRPEEAARVYSAFLRLANDLLPPGGCCCCCCCGGGGPDPQFARWTMEMDAVIGFKMAVVWDKGGLGMGWHYRRNYEFVLVAEKRGGACHWYGGNDVPNVIRDIGKIIPTAQQHPTEKPVALSEFFIKLHSQAGEIVLDPFMGSGSTLIAADKLGRRAFGLELSPEYCNVILQRFADFTGKDPIREDGVKWSEL